MFDELMDTAVKLGMKLDTEWAKLNERTYDDFEHLINMYWEIGEITDEQFDEIASTAFFDYNPKCEY